MPEKPVLHGRDHRPGGTDPIPGIGDSIKWAYLPGVTKTLAGNGGGGSVTTVFSGNSGFFYTNASSVFAAGSTVIGGATYYGINVLSAGHYLAWPYFGLSSGAPGNPIDFILQFNSSGLSESFWEALPVAQVIASLTHSDQAGASKPTVLTAQTGSSFPLGPILYQVTNYTNYAPAGFVHVIVVQLDTDGTGI